MVTQKLLAEIQQTLVLRKCFFFSLVVPHIFMLMDGYQVYLSAGAVSDFVIAASMLYFARTFFLESLSFF